MPTTLTTAREAVFGILNADATFKGYLTGLPGAVPPVVIFADIASQGALPLYCVIGYASPGADTLSAPGGFRILSNPLVRVAVCGPQSQKANIELAYARADALLCPAGAPTRNTSGTLAIYRESPYTLTDPQLVDSEAWVQFGGLYRIIL